MSTITLLSTPPPVYVDVRRGRAVKALASLKPGVRIIGLTMGQFSLLDLISACLDKTGPADVWISTWTAGIRDAKMAGLMLDNGRITNLSLLVDRSFPTRQPSYCAAVRSLFGDKCIRTTRTHAKIALISNGEWAISIRSSMNLNRNPRMEQFDLDENQEIFEFFRGHFDELGDAMPDGPTVPTREVDRVFELLRLGKNPFDPEDEEEARPAPPPIVEEPVLSPEDEELWSLLGDIDEVPDF